MIKLSDVSKSYARSGVKAIDGLSLEARNGEIFGFLGPNGAGKTTTIKIVTGVLAPDSGRASLDGIDVVSEPMEAKRRLGYVSDNPEVFSKLRAWEYLNFVADVYGVPTALRQERVARYAGMLEIKDALDAQIGSFSHGMKQKLQVTASLIHDPSNWILDEPMVGLDPMAAFRLKELMRARADEGKTVFFSTHVMEVAERVCDRLAIISKGRIIFQGTLEELRSTRGSDGTLENLFLQLVDDEGADGAEAVPNGGGAK
ncbi:MAG: ABC transporter ATP-binding protein [Spirochaetales bacterium]|nr:ABC transporter ATP-binding protein [Spirochaetales bacterium]